MGEFIADNIISIFFGFTTLITSAMALHYKRLEHRQRVEKVLLEGRRAGLFLSREAMIRYLLAMYDQAREGDVIWAQCVRCTDLTPKVRAQILKAAGRGARFRMMVNKYSPAVEEFRALFEPLHNAELVEGGDNAISLQGLSEQVVVISFPGVDSYTAVLVRDQYFVQLFLAWFDERFKRQAYYRSAT
jgi:hypothetical protein